MIVRVRPLNDRENFLGKQSLAEATPAVAHICSFCQTCTVLIVYSYFSVTGAGGGMCIQQVASSTIRVLSAPDTPHFTFDAVVDMSVQQEGVFAGMSPFILHLLPVRTVLPSAICCLQHKSAYTYCKLASHTCNFSTHAQDPAYLDAMLCYAMLCYAMLCYAMLRYAMLLQC